MNTALVVANLFSWVLVLVLGFFVIGVLRSLGLVNWRLDQLELTRPSRLGRDGLKLGTKAPDFTLPSATSGEISLHDFAGRKVLLVFTQSGCGPCHDVVPELNRLHDRGEYRVLVINNGDPDSTRQWAAETGARFPVAGQEKFSLSKLYESFATPFAFVIDERGTVQSKGIAGSRQHLHYVLTGAGRRNAYPHVEAERDSAVERETARSISPLEVSHV